MGFLVLLFILLGVCIFIFGLFANKVIDETFIHPIFYHLFKYGRANAPTREKSAFVKWVEVPKSWFTHFYLYCTLIQSYIFYTLVGLYLLGKDPKASSTRLWLSSSLDLLVGEDRSPLFSPSTSLLVSLLFLIQVSRRFYETRWVNVFSDTKMNLIHYILGFLHYTGSALSLIAYNPGFGSESLKDAHITWNGSKEQMTTLQLIGIVLFLFGTVAQYQAHVTLANLRKIGNNVVTRRHKIPYGGLFELVSCPNYFAEIVIYTSFAFIFSFQNTCWNAVLFWVIANQVSAGVMNHLWYKEKFPEYPKGRKAVIPYVW